mgnify:CR=1 FL=1
MVNNVTIVKNVSVVFKEVTLIKLIKQKLKKHPH